MKTIVSLLVTLVALPARQDVPQGTLTVRIIGFAHARGMARVALTDAGSIMAAKAPVRAEAVAIRDGTATSVFRDVPFGSYAVQTYHDENGNGRLDRNVLGIPSEPYGFSNNARAATRAPTYSEAEFRLKVAAMTIEIRVR